MHNIHQFNRDVKPSNILVKTTAKDADLQTVSVVKLEVKLCDFGLSRETYSQSETMSLTIAGTKDYMPPEAREAVNANESTMQCLASFDIFSAGVVTHELSTGNLYRGIYLHRYTCKIGQA